jgi:hypothetical protein
VAVPVVATVVKGSWKVRVDATVSVFEIWTMDHGESIKCDLISRDRIYTLMRISFVAVRRVTLQKVRPVLLGNVLGRYSSPRLRLNNYIKARG